MANKILTDTERLEVAMQFVFEDDLDKYTEICDYMEENNCDFNKAYSVLIDEDEDEDISRCKSNCDACGDNCDERHK